MEGLAMLIEGLLGELAVGKATDLLIGAGGSVIGKVKKAKDWKKVFIDSGKEFIAQHRNADIVFEDIAEVLSQKNMAELAKLLKPESGYELKNQVLSFLIERMEKYEIPHEEALLYANQILYVIVEEIKETAPEKYDRFFQLNWREEQTEALKAISDKIDKVEREIAMYRGYQVQIFSADDINLQLRTSTNCPQIGISFFEIDDEDFCDRFEGVKNEETIYISAKCQEEAIYCIINQLWKYNDSRAIFVVKTSEDWARLQKISETGNIYIPYFYADEIPAIPGNTNIFVFPEHIPTFSQDTLMLRKRTFHTIANCLQKAGMETNAANALVSETNGLYIPLKRKIFNGAFLKEPGWVSDLPDNTKKVALLLGQWTDAHGDQLLIESLSGLPFSEFIQHITRNSKSEEPLVCISKRHGETVYYLTSVENTWEYLSVNIDDPLWKQFVQVFIEVINEDEKLFTYSSQERLVAQMKGEQLFWSGAVRNGMIRTLIMKTFYRGDEACQAEMDNLVTQILDYIQNEDQWKYISLYFSDLCEISPRAVINRLYSEFEHSTGLVALFQNQTSDFLFGRNEYINILFGIEEFLLQKQFFLDGMKLLLFIDSQNFEFKSDAPKDTFRKIFCPFHNFSILQRPDEKAYFAQLAFEKTNNAWDYISSELPDSDRMVFGELHAPKYRPHTSDGSVTVGEYTEAVNAYLQLLLKHSEFNPERWIKLLACSEELGVEQRKLIFDGLLYDVRQMDDEDIIKVKNKLRETIYRHRFFSSASWAMPEKKITQYEALLSQIHTIKPEFEFEYLFHVNHLSFLLHPEPYEVDNAREHNEAKEQQLISDNISAFKENGYDLGLLVEICDKSDNCKLGWYLATYWEDGRFNPEIFQILVERQARGSMAIDYYRALAKKGNASFQEILDISMQAGCSNEMIANLYDVEARCCAGIPAIASAQEDIKCIFWKKNWLVINNYEWALPECQKYGSVSSLVDLLYQAYQEHKIGTELLYDYFITLDKLEINTSNGLDYYLTEILEPLQKEYIHDTMRCGQIARIEVFFHPLLKWENMKCCNAIMAQSPETYADMVSVLYLKEGEEKKENQSDAEKQRISTVYNFFEKAKFCPGEQNGKIQEDILITWVENFQKLLSENKQSHLLGFLLGKVFANSPVGEDGYYPGEPIRRIIEQHPDDSLIREYRVEVYNRRGVFSPSAGKEEQALSEKYLANAEAIALQYPKTAEIFYGLAYQYQSYAKQERENAENGWY